jgi:hypothetical protein
MRAALDTARAIPRGAGYDGCGAEDVAGPTDGTACGDPAGAAPDGAAEDGASVGPNVH